MRPALVFIAGRIAGYAVRGDPRCDQRQRRDAAAGHPYIVIAVAIVTLSDTLTGLSPRSRHGADPAVMGGG
jgi:hypothetical protein